MKPIKKLEPLSKKDYQQNVAEKLESTLKTMMSCLDQMSQGLVKNIKKFEQITQNIKPESNPYHQSLTQSTSNPDPYSIQSKSMHEHEGNERRKQQRFQCVNVSVPVINSQDEKGRKRQIVKWVGLVCKQVLSIGFLMLRNQELQVNKVKSYCSQNIIRNLLVFSQTNKLTPQEMQMINQQLATEIFPYFCLKYPETEQSQINLAFAKELTEENNIDDNGNDLVFQSQVKFKLEESGNYNSQIMQFFNFIIRLPNIVQKQEHGSATKQEQTLGKKYKRDMENIFRMVESQQNIIKMKKFDPKHPEKIIELEAYKKQSEKQIQQHLEKVRSYTSYFAGRKLSQNFKQFSENEINSGNLRLGNSAIMRVVTKWCEELWKYFDQSYVLNREYPFRMMNGEQKFMKRFCVVVLTKLLARQKKIILLKLKQINQNNYYNQSHFSHAKLNDMLSKFSAEDGLVGQFATATFRNYQNYLINYLNLLIHGIKSALNHFENFINVEKNRMLQEQQYQFDTSLDVTDEELTQIMERVENDSNPKQNIQGDVPELITFKIGDLLRCKCASKETEITAIYRQLMRISYQNPNFLKLVRLKNRLDGGNRDILLNFFYREQILVQVQLSIKSDKSKFITCSNKFNHFLYELKRAQFGPISEMCSIWMNQDLRSLYYMKFFDKVNSRSGIRNEKRSIQVKESSSEEIINFKKLAVCCSNSINIQHIRLPFTCNQCKCYYYHCSFTEKHVSCLQCHKNTCYLCQIDNLATTQEIVTFLPQLKIGDQTSVSKLRFSTDLLMQQGAILNIKSKQKKPAIFKTIRVQNQILLFENVNEDFKQSGYKIRLLHRFKSDDIPQQFAKQNIVFTSEAVANQIPQITMQMAQDQYLIPKYLKESIKNAKNSITIVKKQMQETMFTKQKDWTWPKVKRINLAENKLASLDILHQRFQNLQLAALNNNKIRQISDQCSKWKELKYLYLQNNFITEIHENFGQLQNLLELRLMANQLRTIPRRICQLKKLVYLNLDGNPIEYLPPEIGQLHSLQYLNVANSSSEKLESFPESLGKLKKLKKLHVWNNWNFKTLPQALGDMESLDQIIASMTKIEKLPQSIGKLKKLKLLKITDSKLKQLPDSFGQMEFLQNLNMSNNEIENLPDNFGNLSNLKQCILYTNKIRSLPQSIGNMRNLVTMELCYNSIEQLPDSIGKMEKLQTLIINSNKLQSFNKNLCNIKSLKVLIIYFNQIPSIPPQIEHMSSLDAIELSENQLADGSIPDTIANMTNLTKIAIEQNKFTKVPQPLLKMRWLQKLTLGQMKINALPSEIQQMNQLLLFKIDVAHLDPQYVPMANQIMQESRKRYKQFMQKNK